MTYDEIPWTNVVMRTRTYTVFADSFPVSQGHVLFVPREQDWDNLADCYKAAYMWGHSWVDDGYCDSFNIGQNVGSEAGQTVEWPHVHLIPRRKGDCENPIGGVRNVLPENNVDYVNYLYNKEKS